MQRGLKVGETQLEIGRLTCKELVPLSPEDTKSGECIFSMSGKQVLKLMSEIVALGTYVSVTDVLVLLLRGGRVEKNTQILQLLDCQHFKVEIIFLSLYVTKLMMITSRKIDTGQPVRFL